MLKKLLIAKLPVGRPISRVAKKSWRARNRNCTPNSMLSRMTIFARRCDICRIPRLRAIRTSAALDGFCESGVKLAEQRIAEGKYEESEVILNEILTDPYNPNCREARTLLTHLHDPGYINKTMGPKFLAKVEEVKKLLTEAEGFYQSGRYDMAMKRYDQVLNLDPYNTAARKGQERIDNTKYQYGVQAYNETRGRAMWQVEQGWEQPVRQYGTGVGPIESVGRPRRQ